jgi:putative ABC transport system substrate-binding protein
MSFRLSSSFITVVILSTFILIGFYFYPTTKNNTSIIAITQIAPHPSLDLIRQGIMDELNESPHKNSEIIFQNAQGNISTATQIAQRFISLNPKVIIPITTPSAQMVQAAAHNKNIPIVFAAVTDPGEARLIKSDGENLPFITGVQDAPPYDEQIKQMQTLLNKKNLRIGIIYNPGEINSLSQIKHFEKALSKDGSTILLSPATSTVNVSTATARLVDRVDAFYLPNDNTVISSLASVLKITDDKKIPVFSSDPESVKRGCTASIAPDQYQIGRQVGKIVIRILNGQKAEEIPYEKSKINSTQRNEAHIKMLRLSLQTVSQHQGAS